MTFAVWLDTTFSAFDSNILSAMHHLAVWSGGVFTPLMNFVSMFGAKGLFSIILGLFLLLFSKTRKVGFAVLFSVLISAIVCNVVLKPLVARARPYTKYPYNEWWQEVGAHKEKDFSFPSGHVNNISAVLFSLFILSNKKRITWVYLLGVLLMCMSRNYLIVHYPTDVIVGAITGVLSSILGCYVTKLVYKFIDKNLDKRFCNFLLKADLMLIFNKKRP